MLLTVYATFPPALAGAREEDFGIFSVVSPRPAWPAMGDGHTGGLPASAPGVVKRRAVERVVQGWGAGCSVHAVVMRFLRLEALWPFRPGDGAANTSPMHARLLSLHPCFRRLQKRPMGVLRCWALQCWQPWSGTAASHSSDATRTCWQVHSMCTCSPSGSITAVMPKTKSNRRYPRICSFLSTGMYFIAALSAKSNGEDSR